MKKLQKAAALSAAMCLCAVGTAQGIAPAARTASAATKDISSEMEWGTLRMGGAGFVSGIVTGQREMYLRTDVGGVYRYNYFSV